LIRRLKAKYRYVPGYVLEPEVAKPAAS